MTDKLAIVTLAGGRGKRMKSDLPKVVFKTLERSLIGHVLETASKLTPDLQIVVTGFKREVVESTIEAEGKTGAFDATKVKFCEQKEQKGTGDAAKSALPLLKEFSGIVVILLGDAPLIRAETLLALVDSHKKERATVTILSFVTEHTKSYGRVVRDPKTNCVTKIVETKDCTPEELLIRECNSGIYAVDSAFLEPALTELKNENAQGEYYLTDIIERAAKEGQNISTLISQDPLETEGVNNLVDLATVNEVLLERQRRDLIESGVTLIDPSSVYIDQSVKVAPGVVIGPHVQIKGDSEIEAGVVLEGSAYLVNTKIGSNTRIKFSVRAEDAIIGANAQIGPFAHLRPGTSLAHDVHIGNFVETKKARLEAGAKANHLTYLGDCLVGEKTNIGAGTITCNYDGVNKHTTTIGKEVFVGSDTCFIAPVTIHDRAVIGAGSVITKDVESEALALTRANLVVKPHWSSKKKTSKK